MKGTYHIRGTSFNERNLKVYVGSDVEQGSDAVERMATMTPAETMDLGLTLVRSAQDAGIKIISRRR